tara:strand:+ start:183 stop:683 length:501 start_codon:yes stop_codon:yes gene_type:complete
MSTLNVSTIIPDVGTDTDLDLSGKGTGRPDLQAGFKVGGTAGIPTASIRDSAVTLAKLDTSTLAGVAKVTLSATISGSTHTIQASVNVSSLTDDGAGRTDVVYTSNMNNDDYSASGNAGLSGYHIFVHMADNSEVTTSQHRRNTTSDAGTHIDYTVMCATIHGDLA